MQSLERRPFIAPVQSAADRLAARGFTAVDRPIGGGVRRASNLIRLAKSGHLTLSLEAYAAIGSPRRVLLMSSPDNNTLAVVATRDNDPKGYTLAPTASKTIAQATSGRLAATLTDGINPSWFQIVSNSDGVIEADRVPAP